MKVDYPYLRKSTNPRELHIEVMADSMRVGKSTAVKVIAEGLRKKGEKVTESYEDWQHNPYLKASYEDPQENFLQSQKWFARRKWEQIKEGGKGIFIQDVSPEMDFCYAATNLRLGRMNEKQFQIYDSYYKSLDWNNVFLPTILIYLTVSDDNLIQRALDSRREFETVEPDYFLMMKKVNREWVKGVSTNYRVLFIDTDNLNFAENQKDKDRMISIVIDSISN